MGYGDVPVRILTLAAMGFIIEVVIDAKAVEANVSGYFAVVHPGTCPSSCSPKNVIEPDIMWDAFPCPPPWKRELFLQLNWTRLSEPADRQRVRDRVAKRCNINLKELQNAVLESSGQSLIFIDCDANCFIPILATITCVVFLFVALVAFFIKRQHRARLKSSEFPSESTTPHAVARQENHLYMRSPDGSGEMIPRPTESVLADAGVEIRLLDSQPEEKHFIIPKGYDRFYGSQKGGKYHYKRGRLDTPLPMEPSEDTSATYSGTDTNHTDHTYESVRGSIYSGSLRLSGSQTGSCEQKGHPAVLDFWTQNIPPDPTMFKCGCPKYGTQYASVSQGNNSVYYDSDNYSSHPYDKIDQNVYPYNYYGDRRKIVSDTETTDNPLTTKWKRKQFAKKRRLTEPHMRPDVEPSPKTRGQKSNSHDFDNIPGLGPCQCEQCRLGEYQRELMARQEEGNIYQSIENDLRNSGYIYGAPDYDSGCNCQMPEVDQYRDPYWVQPPNPVQQRVCNVCVNPDQQSMYRVGDRGLTPMVSAPRSVHSEGHSGIDRNSYMSPELYNLTQFDDNSPDHRKTRRNKSVTNLTSPGASKSGTAFSDSCSTTERPQRTRRIPKTNGSLYKSKLMNR
ncbi:uncharacterized protein LOC110457780 [Mizuhopecten yessoensis]|uniref:uncharacterized protein LOC110457780 n=1 Tax=Mizuhopecten yessoensis TaxID=6573 RepID=UPI000B45B148|nr:uncharacterized protein LOC110457780 [Mizuhopecten yessoensis]